MNRTEHKFIETVWSFYKAQGRHSLPWRKTKDPYRILVSEVMLQQTQVQRVIPKYEAFIERFPDVGALANAPLREVLYLWQGLGYNRRAKMLHSCAKVVSSEYAGVFPNTHKALVALPGIGPYTASAILSFAFSVATPLIETNVRSVYLHHFFKDKTQVSDTELLQYIERTLDTENVRTWYWALMDYGAHIKKEYGNPNAQSSHYTKQSVFKGSDRQIRGAILRTLTAASHSRVKLHSVLASFEDIRIDAQLHNLMDEGMIVKKGRIYMLPD